MFLACTLAVGLLLLSALVDAHPIKLAHRTIASAQRAKRSAVDTELEPGIYVLQFKQRIDAVGMRRLIGVLGYEPDDYVPRHGLLIYVNGSTQAEALQRALETRMARLFRLIASDRQANIGAEVHRIISRPGGQLRDRFVIYRNQSRTGQAVRHDVPRDPNVLVLRAHIIGLTAENVRDTIDINELETFVSNFSRTRIAARFPNHEVLILRNVHREDAAAVADALVRRFPFVAWVEVRPQFKLMNKWSVPSIERRSDSLVGRSAQWRPLGTGKGQLISTSDTGIATSQCFFSDGLGARAGTVPRTSSTTAIPADNGHPKFRAYTSGVGGDFDDSNGHGTHTAGTLTGRAAAGSGAALFNGVASDARLCYFDLLGASGEDALSVPDDLSVIFQWSLDCGANVHSGSWGAEAGGQYTADERSTDLFAYRNRFFLPVFAAGNAGPGRNTVGSPGCAKNALTIGAVMNGASALSMATGSPPSGGASAYNNTRVGDFSSRGDYDARSAAKVDLVADGGAYVWSAAFDAPKSGSCESTSEAVLGLEGTSMATPAVAGAAVLVREWLIDNVVLETLPTASLLRAMLIASAQPTDGPFPGTKPFASYSDRRNSEGFGRVVLDQILSANLRIVSNERGQFGLARAGDILRLCVAIEGLSPLSDSIKDGTDLVIVLSYADYPTAIGLAQAELVNDLDLLVRTATNSTPLSVNGQPAGVRETMLTNERVVLRSPRAVDISVAATSIDFGSPQTFSLVLALRGPNAANYRLLVSTPQVLHGESQSPCSLCGASKFLAKSDCIVCGDGVVSPPLEQCEPSLSGAECCDATSCRWAARDTLCATQIGGCLAQGRCVADSLAPNASMSCSPSNSLSYRMRRVPNFVTGKVDVLCETTGGKAPTINSSSDVAVSIDSTPQPSPAPAAPVVCANSVGYWVDKLRNYASAYSAEEDRLCCARFSAYAEQRAPADPLYHALALEYIATHLNANAHVTSEQLVALRAAQLLLEKQCGTSAFIAPQDREDAHDALTRLESLSLPICADEKAVPPPTCTPPLRGTEESELLCNGPPNRYIEVERRCSCGAMYHVGEPDCRDLACSGNGASVYDYAARAPACVCLLGWAGASCSRCADAPRGARYMCIGMPSSLVVAQHTHVLLMVDQASVTSRLDGTYYPSSVPKEADSLPGVAPLDCACRRAANRITPASFETHIETLEAALEESEEEAALWAAASALLYPRPLVQAGVGAAAVIAAPRVSSDAQARRAASASTLMPLLRLLVVPTLAFLLS